MSLSDDAVLARVRAAKPHARKIFGDLLGDVAVGITRIDGAYGLKINVASAPDPALGLPTAVDGIPVCIEVTGAVRKRKAVTARGARS